MGYKTDLSLGLSGKWFGDIILLYWQLTLTLIFAMVFAIGLFVALPYVLSLFTGVKEETNPILFNLIDGVRDGFKKVLKAVPGLSSNSDLAYLLILWIMGREAFNYMKFENYADTLIAMFFPLVVFAVYGLAKTTLGNISKK